MNSLGSRLLSAIGASAAQQSVTILIQVASVPLLLSAWGVVTYGHWIILAATPTYLSLSDFGFTASAGNTMAMAYGKGDHRQAQIAFSSSLCLSLLSMVLISIISISATWALPAGHMLGATSFTDGQSAIILSALAMIVLLSMLRTTLYMVLFADGRYPLGGFLLTACRLIEFIFLAGAALAGRSASDAAIAQCLGSLVATSAFYLYVRLTTTWIQVSPRHCQFADVRRLLAPSATFMIFPLAFALNLQGVIMVIGREFPAAAVVTFATTRTLTRFASLPFRQILEMARSELSRAYGSGDLLLLKSLVQGSTRVSVWLGLAMVAGLLAFGPMILKTWTRSHVEISFAALTSLGVASYFQMIGYGSYTALYSCNTQKGLAAAYLAINLSLLAALPFVGAHDLSAAATAVMYAEFALLIATVTLAARLIQIPVFRFAIEAIKPPRDEVRAIGRAISKLTLQFGQSSGQI